ncbi:MAG: hypothetical protein A2660_01025 [Candidatus Doudnabacteria bacterium RIFCSPHIGHO2_01_FULL_45_18]|uniref:Rod shape-determining protein MreD n=1 Tax=Candidatus Doudnabacteria bacterium RIFCSPHIGHO2_01_FULL_45_18 TaxID=1817823 RepID=A0A1F5NRL0_9BACT|nr:MAG: hypothetical protein A2660_01025 [Candidatus Doudnabacteria bacterium RIFCSPHIGHO2_01_FULL_45_18]
MRNAIWILALFALVLVQGGILAPLKIEPINLLLVAVVSATILCTLNQGLLIVIVSGLFLDFLSRTPDGLVTASLLILFLILWFVLNEILAREPNLLIVFSSVAASTILFFLIFTLFNSFFVQPDIRYIFLTQLPLTLLWNLVLTYPVFKYFFWIHEKSLRFAKP